MNLNDRLATLSELITFLSSSPVPTHQFQVLADYAGTILPHNLLALCLTTPDQNSYLLHPLVNDNQINLPTHPILIAEGGAIGDVFRTAKKRTITLADYANSHEVESALKQAGLQTAMLFPLQQGAQVLGVLYVAGDAGISYTDADQQIGGLLAAGLSGALENARLYQQLADERSTIAAVLGSTTDGILLVNAQGTILLINPEASNMLAIDANMSVGKQLQTVIGTESILLTMLSNLETPASQEFILADKRVVQANRVTVTTPFGEEIGSAAIMRDVTHFKEVAEMKNEFVNTVSHDLKNPISSILLAAELINKVGDLSPPQEKMRTTIVRTVNYMQELVSDLLDLGQIEAGMGVEMAAVNLSLLIKYVLKDFQTQAREKSLKLVQNVPPHIQIHGDEDRLKQVLHNLVGNAIKYTNAGIIQLTVTPKTEHILVEVQDSGLGIPQADLPQIFDKFYRVDSEDREDIKGTGLGLAITKQIIEQHGGQIWVESQVGTGSKFCFILPAT